MSSVPELKANWQAAQAAADIAYSTHLSASRAAAISWGGNGRINGASYSARQAWQDADRVADDAYAAYASANNTERSAATV